MSFRVSPSDQVVISMDEAGPDDFLQLTLSDSSKVYVRRMTGTEGRLTRLSFDEQFLPDGYERKSLEMAILFLRRLSESVTATDIRALRKLYDDRSDPTERLQTFVARRFREAAGVTVAKTPAHQTWGINVGRTLTVRFDSRLEGIVAPSPIHVEWVATAPIISVVAVDRFQAEFEVAQRLT